jgi:hypothetical protein
MSGDAVRRIGSRRHGARRCSGGSVDNDPTLVGLLKQEPLVVARQLSTLHEFLLFNCPSFRLGTHQQWVKRVITDNHP